MGTIPTGITILDRMSGPVDRKRKRERRQQIQDLNLPVDEHDAPKSPRAQASSYPANTIILEDDEDDDVQVCSPQSIARARLATSSTSRRQRLPHRLVSQDDSLQLSLQLWHSANPLMGLKQGQHRPVLQLSGSAPLDASEDCIVLGSNVQPQKKVQREPEPVKLICAICLDTMKEEMSTVCGHVFCRECIFGAIRAQKRCPTCRRKLTAKEVHRIYL